MIGGHLRSGVLTRRLPMPVVAKVKSVKSQEMRLIDLPRVQDSFNPLAIMLMGPRGRGKTLALSALGDLMKQRYALNGYDECKVFANFPTIDADLADPRIMEWITKWVHLEIRNGLLLADEIQGEASSAKWNSNVNFDLVQAITQIRKRQLECVFTTQFPRGIEKGLLEQIDFFIEVRKLGDGFGIAFAIHDWKDQFTSTPRRHRPFPPFWWEADYYYTWYGTKQYFGHYASLGQQIPRYMAAKDPEQWGKLVGDQWRTHGFDIPDVSANEEGEEELLGWTNIKRDERIEAGRELSPAPALVVPQDYTGRRLAELPRKGQVR